MRHYLFRGFVLAGVFFTSLTAGIAQQDSLLYKVAARFVANEHYQLEKILPPAQRTSPELAPEHWLNCYSNKEVMVVAVYALKPTEPYGRMLVQKKMRSQIKFDEHFFQDVGYDEALGIHYALLKVLFPKEANPFNCRINVQVYDKGNEANGASLLVLTR